MRRAYLFRLIGHNFPRSKFGKDWRSFQEAWYKQYDWLEYSVEKQAAYCFYCFLFKPPNTSGKFGYDAFTKKGFKNWKKGPEYFKVHVGKQNSAHNNARRHCEDFRNQKQSVSYAITCHEEKSHLEYEERLRAVVGIARFLVSQGLAFRGHDESDTSLNKGNFLEMVDWFAERCKDVANVMNDNAPGNHKLTSPKIQKQIVQACAEETIQGYDGASNMRGELNGLKKLVLDVNPHAFYVHCFAHQLQLVVVAVVKGVLAVGDFFGHTNKIVTMVSVYFTTNIYLGLKYLLFHYSITQF
jgi:hypothetical protein